MNNTPKNYTIRLSNEQYQAFQILAKKEKTKVSKLLRHLIYSNPAYTSLYKKYILDPNSGNK